MKKKPKFFSLNNKNQMDWEIEFSWFQSLSIKKAVNVFSLFLYTKVHYVYKYKKGVISAFYVTVKKYCNLRN